MSDTTQPNAEPATATRSPIDYDTLRKGDYITPDVIEKLTGVSRTDVKAFSFALMGAKEKIEQEMNRRGSPVMIKSELDGLRVLKDDEAVEYARSRHKNLSKQMVSNHVRAVASVDVRMLSADQLRRHERDVIARSRELQAMKDQRRRLSAAEQQKTEKQLSGATDTQV